jgi:hypothetical protein
MVREVETIDRDLDVSEDYLAHLRKLLGVVTYAQYAAQALRPVCEGDRT